MKKKLAIETLKQFHKIHSLVSEQELKNIKSIALQNGNVFEGLMEASKTCTLGQLTHALYQVGGKYRRNM